MNSSPSLVSVPIPLEREIPNSWLLRLAEMHRASVPTITRYVGIILNGDCDFALGDSHLAMLLQGVQTPKQLFAPLPLWFQNFRKQLWLSVFLRSSSNGTSVIGFCPQCILSDPIPYWRFEWRMRFWVVCPKHHCRILDSCSHCDEQISLDISSAKWGKQVHGANICCTCPTCGEDFCNSQITEDLSCVDIDELVRTQRTVIAALLKGSFNLHGGIKDVPLELLPSILTMRSLADPDKNLTSSTLDPRLYAELHAAIHHIRTLGVEGYYPRKRTATLADNAGRLWKEDTKQLTEIALKIRFFDLIDDLQLLQRQKTFHAYRNSQIVE